MGELIKDYKVDRMLLKDSAQSSAEEMVKLLRLAQDETTPSKHTQNRLTAARSFAGVLDRNDDGRYFVTGVGHRFLGAVSEHGAVPAWEWLLTRSLWLLEVPNGTKASYNQVASRLGIRFNLFRLVASVCQGLAGCPAERRFLYFDELLALLDEDANWASPPDEILRLILERRSTEPWRAPRDRRGLLDGLEADYGAGRDNWNTVLGKSCSQTGLFDFMPKVHGRSDTWVGMAIRADLGPLKGRRLRFVIDEERRFDAS